MTEQKTSHQELPPFLYPEYWAGHSPRDLCLATEFITVPSEQMGRLREESYAFLDEFLLLPAQNIVRSYREGETFNASQERNGTIILVNIEDLEFRSGWPGNPTKSDKWGVVVDYEDVIDAHKIVTVFDVVQFGNNSRRIRFWGLLRPDLTVSHVDHVRKTVNGVLVEEYFRMFNSLKKYRNGTPLREGIPAGRLIPKFPRLPKLHPVPHSA